MARDTLLERIVEQHAAQVPVGRVSVAVEHIAEEIAREALADETFRRTLHELVRTRSQRILDRLLRDSEPRRKATTRRRRRRP